MITSEQLIREIREFRSACLKRYPEDVDLLNGQERSDRLGAVPSQLSDYLSPLTNQPIDQLCRLVKTPRLLKTILRQVQEMWKNLHGEIDFDDLLVSTVIRFATPEAFDFLLENFRAIRAMELKGIGNTRQERVEQLQNKWSRLKDANWDTATTIELVAFMFPMWKTDSIRTRNGVPQGVAISEPTDYWKRLLAGELSRDEIRDQETIQAIRKWERGKVKNHFRQTTLPEALSDSAEFSAKFEQFAPLLLDGQSFRKLASALFEIMQLKYGVSTDHESAPGFIPLWRCAIRHPVDIAAHKEWIKEEIFRYLPRSLRFANDLYYYWRTNDQAEIHGNRNTQDLRQPVVQRAKELFRNDSPRFLSVLDPAFMYSSYHFAVLNSEPEQGGPGFLPQDWRWFTHLLLEAGELDADTVVPQIAVFVCKEEMRFGGFHCHFEEDKARDLFGDEYGRLLELLRREIDTSKFDDREKNRLATVRTAARNLAET